MSVKLRRLWIQLTSDRKRFGMLCAVVVVAMLLWARLIVVSRMPRMAVADEFAESAVNGTESESTSGDQLGSVTPISVSLASAPKRDPFVISPRYFPKPTSIGQLTGTTEKSAHEPVEEPMQVQQRITAHLSALAEKLRLEAALNGNVAVINGRTCRVGDVLAVSDAASHEPVEFRLVEVGQRSAILECQDRRFEIQMNRP